MLRDERQVFKLSTHFDSNNITVTTNFDSISMKISISGHNRKPNQLYKYRVNQAKENINSNFGVFLLLLLLFTNQMVNNQPIRDE